MSFLANRSHRTYCDDLLSDASICNTGVPQGSILSPLLFILIINDLHFLELYSNIFSYADDTTIIHSSNNTQECVTRLNIDLGKILSGFTIIC